MTVNALKAKGVLLQRGDGGGPEAFVTVAEVTNITGPGLSQEMIDVTSHESPDYREYIPGIGDGGEVTFDLNYIPDNASHDATAGILKDWEDQLSGVLSTPRNYKLVWTDVSNTEWIFPAWLSSFEPGANASGTEKLLASVTLKVTGQPTLA